MLYLQWSSPRRQYKNEARPGATIRVHSQISLKQIWPLDPNEATPCFLSYAFVLGLRTCELLEDSWNLRSQNIHPPGREDPY